jgi:hypothetical protein
MALDLDSIRKKAKKSAKKKNVSEEIFGKKKKKKVEDNDSFFSTGGFASVEENEKRVKIAKENYKRKIQRFWMKDGETATIRFLTEEPITFYQHNVPRGGNKFDKVTCSGEDCEYCDDGKPQFVGAFLIIDRRKYKNKEGKTIKRSIKLLVQCQTVLSQLKHYHEKRGLTKMDYEVTRSGSDKNTAYNWDRLDKSPLSSEDKKLIKEVIGSKTFEEVIIDSIKPIEEDEEPRRGGGKKANLSSKIRKLG